MDSDLAVIGLTGIGPIQKISISGVLSYWLNDFFLYCIDRFDHIKANKSKLINKMFDQRTLLGTSANQKRHYLKSYNKTYYPKERIFGGANICSQILRP